MMDDLWTVAAKWDEQGGSHPLIYHMIDSGQVASALWQYGLTEGARQQFSTWINLSQQEAGRLIAYWTSLHDLGKAAPSFQSRCNTAKEDLQKLGFTFPNVGDYSRHHGLLTAWALENHCDQLYLEPRYAARQLLLALGGHHGIFPSFHEFNERHFRKVNLGDAGWDQIRLKLFNQMVKLFNPPSGATLNAGKVVANGFFDVLTGMFITADWIASNTGTNFFPYCMAELAPEEYYLESEKKALNALKYSGWTGWQPDQEIRSFHELFPAISMPNIIQQAVIDNLGSLRDPCLIILEAPTGSGKTEIALCIADRCIKQEQLRGFYVAMPTQATSNQMFDRVRSWLGTSYPNQRINFQLVHSGALLKEEYLDMQISGIADNENDPTSGVNALSWFTPKKLALLAPFGVGTVDQAFLSVLQARHFPLRLFGLLRKVVIFDEVHAYDVYMVEIFKRLLAWLRSIGTSVIILSATLPKQTRRELLEAFNPQADTVLFDSQFPRLSINNSCRIQTIPLGKVIDRQVDLEFIDHTPASVTKVLRDKLASGGNAAVICNTVDRAQKIYQTLVNSGDFDRADITLFHSRFPFCWRENIEEHVKKNFGRLKQQPSTLRKGIVVATQVIEQSLDLDFDLMISDLAPLDLIIQRIGRLQRHSGMQFAPIRPYALRNPLFVVTMPEWENELIPNFGSDVFVYDEVFLQRSYFILCKSNFLHLPGDSDALIEAVYSDGNLPGLSVPQIEELQALYRKMKNKASAMGVDAENRMIPDVDWGEVLGAGQVDFREDDPTVHRDLQALTRETRPSIQLVCLKRGLDGNLFLLDGMTPFDLDIPPDREMLKTALRSIVTTSDPRVVDYFIHQPANRAWNNSAQLRFTHPAIFDENGTSPLRKGVNLHLHENLGLAIKKEDDDKQ